MSIAFKEGLNIPPPALNEIIVAANQDIRQVGILPAALIISGLQIRGVISTLTSVTCVISSPIPMFYHLLELSFQDNSNKWSNIGFGLVRIVFSRHF